MTVRVLHVISKMDRGGAESLVMGIYRNVDRTKVQFDFAVEDPDAAFAEEIEALGGRTFRVPRPADGLTAFVSALGATIREHGPYRAVHSHVHFFSGVVLAVARRNGVPVRIAQSHTTSDGHPGGLRRTAYRSLMRTMINSRATHRLACSRSAAAGLFGEGAEWVPVVNALDTELAARAEERRGELRAGLGIPDEAPLIVHVGGFRPVKNHSFLLRVFERVVATEPGARLVLAGDGPLRQRVEAEAAELGLADAVVFLGATADVWPVWAGASAAVYPSLYEGVSLAMVEAQAAGVPVVASRGFDPEVDLGLGLVTWAGLDEPPERWAAAVLDAAGGERPPWEQRKGTLVRRGYDLAVVASDVERIYLGG